MEAASTSLPINRFEISDLEDVFGRYWNYPEAMSGGRLEVNDGFECDCW
jgi:hypothetical protein